MDALTARIALPKPTGAHDAPTGECPPAAASPARAALETPAQAWMMRSEAFPEDLEPGPPAFARRPAAARRQRLVLLWGLGLPLCAAAIGLGGWLGLA